MANSRSSTKLTFQRLLNSVKQYPDGFGFKLTEDREVTLRLSNFKTNIDKLLNSSIVTHDILPKTEMKKQLSSSLQKLLH